MIVLWYHSIINTPIRTHAHTHNLMLIASKTLNMLAKVAKMLLDVLQHKLHNKSFVDDKVKSNKKKNFDSHFILV